MHMISSVLGPLNSQGRGVFMGIVVCDLQAVVSLASIRLKDEEDTSPHGVMYSALEILLRSAL